jgi:hypothetical protein
VAKTKTTIEILTKPIKQKRSRPAIHCLVYGDAGAGKSTFAATFGKYEETRPVKVYLFDPVGGKEFPYHEVGNVGEFQEDGFGIPYQDITDDSGELLIRLMVMESLSPKAPEAYTKFEQEYDAFSQSYIEDGWKTVVVDTIDSFALAARKMDQYVLNAKSKDPRQWWAGATDKCEETFCMRLPHLKCNVVVLTHIDRSKIHVHGHSIQGPSSGPGRMDTTLLTYFPEIYRSYVTKDEVGKRAYQLQTGTDEVFVAETHIKTPDPCYPDYESLWENW